MGGAMQTVGTAQMAAMLGASPDKLRAMAKAGEVPYIPIGRVLKFVPENVFAELERKHEREAQTGGGRSQRSRSARRKVF